MIARELAAQGMHVVVPDGDGDAARRVAADVGGTAVSVDLSTAAGADALLDAVGEDVDVLVNCAGGWSPGGRNYPDAPGPEWDSVLTLNLRTPMRLIQGFLPGLTRSPVGAAVSIASSAGRGSDAYASPEYAAAKAGLIRLTTSLADWDERFGVRVSCVVPGWIGLPRAHEEIAALPPGERPELIPPTDVAAAVLELVHGAGSAGRVVVIEDR